MMMAATSIMDVSCNESTRVCECTALVYVQMCQQRNLRAFKTIGTLSIWNKNDDDDRKMQI